MADADALLIRKPVVAALDGGDAHTDLGKPFVGSPELWPATRADRHRSSVWTVMSWVPTTERSRRASADRLVEAERLDLSQYAVARGPVQEAVSTVSAPRWPWIRIMCRADAGSMEAWSGAGG
jgi:hypothetical protein